jgi:2-hydroxycyclohexanecarboxyl-CoA dehydrogenase
MQRVAVVTGAGAGIGRAAALGFAGDGDLVAVVDRDAAAAGSVVDEITATGGTAAAFAVDVTDGGAVRSLPDAVGAVLGAPAVLVNCAGWDEIQPFEAADSAFWERVVAINLVGVIAMTHAFLGPLRECSGRLVNISSDAGRVGSSGETVYAGAKAGVIGFTKSVARELARDGVTANCVCPGPINTAFLAKNPPKLLESLARSIPARRIGEPEDVWPAIRFFASDAASYVTGQVLSVSGGLTMAG